MRKEDFIFLKKEGDNVYFISSDDSAKELWDLYLDEAAYIKSVMYSLTDGCVYIIRQYMFPFSTSTELVDNEELKYILEALIEEI